MGNGDVSVHATNIIAVEPVPGSPSIHQMHLHVCTPDSRSWVRHKRLFADVEDAHEGPIAGKDPVKCMPPSWIAGSGCHGAA